MDVTTLARYAAEAIGIESSVELVKQCHDFAEYARKTNWHHTVRREAKQIAKMFDEIITRCEKELS